MVKENTEVFNAKTTVLSKQNININFFKKPIDFLETLLYNSEAVFDMLL